MKKIKHVNNLVKIIKQNKNSQNINEKVNKINYKNFELHILLVSGYYCGYITKFDKKIEYKFKKIVESSLFIDSKINGI